jgi:hypothetical protein
MFQVVAQVQVKWKQLVLSLLLALLGFFKMLLPVFLGFLSILQTRFPAGICALVRILLLSDLCIHGTQRIHLLQEGLDWRASCSWEASSFAGLKEVKAPSAFSSLC